MSKGYKALLIVLIVVCGLLATSTGFFYAKTASLDKSTDSIEVTKKTVSDTDSTSSTSQTANTEPITTNSTAATTAAPAGNRPSSPSDTVTVADGETLFAIGQKVEVSWTLIAAANGIDADKIKAGDILIIPKNNQVGYTVNVEKAKSIQNDVTSGKEQFRLIPAETAKSDAPPVYGLLATDTFTQSKIDEASSLAEVTVTKDNKTYLIKLIQPVDKGAKGIWAIESIKIQA